MLQQTFDRSQAEVGGRDVESRPVVEVAARGVQHCGGEEQEEQVTYYNIKHYSASRRWICLSVCTSGFRGFEQDSDQLRDVEVSGIVQGVHAGPAAPQTGVGAQRDQLSAESQRGRRVACTHSVFLMTSP